MIQQPAEKWQTLVTTAVLGMERSDAGLLEALGLPDAAQVTASAATAEHRLLNAAAAVSLYVRAGQRPPKPHGTATSAPEPDELRPCSLAAGARLATILTDRPKLLGEWCAAAAASGVAAPPELVPALLDRATAHAEEAPQIQRAIGSRAAWLAALNPRWAGVGVASNDAEQTWTTGTLAERLGLLRSLRRRQPELARQLIESTWREDKGDDREKFIQTLAEGLSMADEPMLESALDDKRKGIRAAAADLLARLPQSRLCRRMLERLMPALQFQPAKKGLLKRGKATITATLPETADKAMVRDGLEARSGAGVGLKGHLLQQMVAASPLDAWTDTWSATPEEVVEAAANSEWSAVLLHGFTDAAAHQGNQPWALALLHGPAMQRRIETGRDARVGDYHTLLTVLDAPSREQVVSQMLSKVKGEAVVDLIAHAIEGHDTPWTLSFTQTILPHVQAAVTSRQSYVYRVMQLLDSLSRVMHPAIAASVETGWPDSPESDPKGLRAAVEKLIATIQFRHDMLKELAS